MLPLFAATLFVSASLLFLVQPMVGKMILPRLGGTPAVWNTCMVFFQGVLLVGYAYTHTLSTRYNRPRQVLIQLAVLLLPFIGFLPFGLGIWEPPAESNPIFHVLWLLLGMVGLPFFVVSTSAPLLQRWFSATDHPAAKDPYFLYGASNLGSMLALVLYPILVEPLFPVETQAVVWTIGYVLFVLLVAVCAGVIWRHAHRTPERQPEAPSSEPVVANKAVASDAVTAKPRRALTFATAKPAKPAATLAADKDQQIGKPLTPLRRLRWVGLAAVPSSLMLGMTTYLTTDIAAIPFFWVIPLALYLLTFIIVFARWPVIWSEQPHDVILYIQPVFLVFLIVILMGLFGIGVMAALVIHSLSFFFIALVCHGELARDRPEPRHLTEFYLWLSVGGVVGGLFNALVAPLLFRFGNIEYPAAMVLACLLRPSLLGRDTLVPGDSNSLEVTRLGRILDYALPIAFALVFFFNLRMGLLHPDRGIWTRRIFALGFGIGWAALLFRPLRSSIGLAGIFLAIALNDRLGTPYLFQDRGFFGFVKVRQDHMRWKDDAGNTVKVETYHTLVHGGINHGMQSMDPERRRLPITYFHPSSGIGQIFEQMKWSDARLGATMVGDGLDPFSALVNLHSEPPYGVVGLGIGTLAAHARPTQVVDFYEIDPLIRRLSVPPDDEEPLFYYIHDAATRGAHLRILMGDGRLVLKRDGPKSYYHVLVLDAFSSDAIPVHLLTADALDEYLENLVPGGILIFNATNRYVDIRPVLADLADSRGMDCYYFGNTADKHGAPDKYPADWVVLQKRHHDWDEKTGTSIPYSGSGPLWRRLVTEAGPPVPGAVVGALALFAGTPQPWEQGVWERLRPPGRRLWTDSFSNLLSVIEW